jgi:hypothetical protein
MVLEINLFQGVNKFRKIEMLPVRAGPFDIGNVNLGHKSTRFQDSAIKIGFFQTHVVRVDLQAEIP